jgi:RNA polymerase sigma factor (sigma-70 family)
MRMFDPLRRVFGHAELFVDRYDALLRSALRVTEGDRQAAEDLVQDAFIRFTLVQPPLDQVERLDAYFYAMLRNMYTSRIRRNGRVSVVSLSILDFDSLDIGLKALDARTRIEVRQTVRAACEYGCVRRHSSKTGSIFLLRFFHGYLPSEIAKIACLTPAFVDERLFHARREAKLFVDRPGQLAFIGADRATRALPPLEPENDDGSEEALVWQLRAMMFRERHDSCWSPRELRALYRNDRAKPLPREQLAALVGCPVCLDEANAIVNVPKLAGRWPTDTLGPGTRGGGGASSPRLASAGRKASEVFEHRPRELRILVNGFELGSHTIGAEPSELVLAANVGEPVALVEVFSEQGHCLLFLDACPPPEGSVRQRRRVELSEGRHAELEVTFGGPWPIVRASYFDPRGAAIVATTVDDVDEQPAWSCQRTSAATKTPWTLRLFGLRPAHAMILVGAIVGWLLFWTPGLEVSAAERIAEAIRWLVTEMIGAPKPMTSSISSAPAPQPAVAEPIAPAARAVVAPSAPRLTPAGRMALELRAIAELQRVEAYLGQEVSFGPVRSDRVELRADVDGDARKQTLGRALASLVRGRDLRAEIEDLREVPGRVRPRDAKEEPERREFVFVKDQFAMFEPLRQHFREQRERDVGGAALSIREAQIDSDVRRFASRVLEHASRASQHAWALKHLADRYPAATVLAASAETQDLWQTVVREHSGAYRKEIASLRTALEPLVGESGLPNSAIPTSPPTALQTETYDLWSRIARLLDVQTAQDEAIQAAFAVLNDSTGMTLVQTPAFWRLLEESDALAAAIASESRGSAMTPPL